MNENEALKWCAENSAHISFLKPINPKIENVVTVNFYINPEIEIKIIATTFESAVNQAIMKKEIISNAIGGSIT